MRYSFTVMISCLLFFGCRTRSDFVLSSNEPSESPKTQPEPPTKGKALDVVISYLEVVQSGANYNVNVASEEEFLCERHCSNFELVEERVPGAVVYKAVRRPLFGNTTPSRLEEKRQIPGLSADVQKIIFKNVGRIGNDIVVNQMIRSDRPNFYATGGTFRTALAIGGESSGTMMDFNGQTIDVSFEDRNLADAVQNGGAARGFVTGYIQVESKIERGDVRIFYITSFDPGI